MLLESLVNVSETVGATRSRKKKIAALADALRRVTPAEARLCVGYLTGELRQGKIGLGWAAVRGARSAGTTAAKLSLDEVDRRFDDISHTRGKGSRQERHTLLTDLFRNATPKEQEFLQRLILGELRQGALEGVMTEAIADAAQLPLSDVQRATMLAGNLVDVAEAALGDGAPGLARFSLELMRPIKPMLAQPAADAGDALDTLGEAVLEYKLDGARVQLHKVGNEVRVFTRRLNDVTESVPELVEAALRLPANTLILDGEVIALKHDGRPHPFQVTMRRFGRKRNVAELRDRLPLSVFFFDLMHLDGEDLIDRPVADRVMLLADTAPREILVPSLTTDSVESAAGFLNTALQEGHEGIMAKAPASPYLAGNRGSSWLKIKPSHTLDLVVLAAEWGSGRREGFLSNLHLGARDPATGGFVMLGKTFKGLTDAMLKWQTRRFLELEIGREGHIVHVRPEVVVEIAFNELQKSSQYPGGLALRFARVKRYRKDKKAVDADTIDTVREISAVY